MGYTMLKGVAEKEYKTADLADSALLFIRETCEGLRFDPEKAGETDTGNYFTGTSLKENQIPFNMEKDIDRLCLENALKRFLESGRKEDAFDVYFCYLEMFVGSYEKTRRMIELLSEYEANGSRLLMSHRDHYSHSVYVFALGLAVYQKNSIYREKYNSYYELTDKNKAACHYLEYWGLASLFHDIGYPFELPFEQVASYFEVNGDERSDRPYIAYHELDKSLKINDGAADKLENIYGKRFADTNELFAYVLTRKLGGIYRSTENEIVGQLKQKPTDPNEFCHIMDHAYFSASVLFNKLFCEMNCDMKEQHIDAITAILLHNSLYKFNIAHYKEVGNIPFKAELHPIAYMLMLCDELQCWDRVAYGRNSKKELHPMGCKFNMENNEIHAVYEYDEKEKDRIAYFEEQYRRSAQKEKPKLKAYSKMYKTEPEEKSDFEKDIEQIVDLNEIKLDVKTALVSNAHSGSNSTLSGSNFVNLRNFAIILNGRYDCVYEGEWENVKNNIEAFVQDEKRIKDFGDKFEKLSIEYKLSNINQAKAFAKYMDAIGCFYSDKEVDFEIVEKFSNEELMKIGIMEHKRWLQEHYDMGWIYGDPKASDYKINRELNRWHMDMIEGFDGTVVSDEAAEKHFKHLHKDEQDKDRDPMECMLAMLKMYDGIRIYRLK